MDVDLRYPSDVGALEIASHLGIDPTTIDFSCQDWAYTYPKLDQLSGFISVYRNCDLSATAKRTLGCFIFQTLDDHLCAGGAESLVSETLRMLANDYGIHEPEFRYWALVDIEDEERGGPDDWFYITRFAFLHVTNRTERT